MSRLQELIQRLCPDGVNTLQVGDFAKAETLRNRNHACDRAYSITQRGLIPTSEYFKEAKVTSEDTSNYKIVKHNWFVYSPSRIDVGSINYLQDEEDVIVSPLNVVFSIKEDIILPQYLLAFLNSRTGTWQILSKREGIEGTGRKMLPFGKFSTIKLPVPPMEVQREIVRILDQFTQLTAELTAELNARKKQYEYYRDALFAFEDEVRQRPLEAEFPSIRNGFVGTITSFFSDEKNGVRYLEGRDIHEGIISDEKAVYVTKEFHNKHLKTQLKPNDIVMVQSGHVGECAVVGDKYSGANCHALIVMSNGGNCDSKYVTYYLQSSEGKSKLASITTGGTVKHILASKIKKVTVPFPPIEEQRRIVAILDRFDALCNDLTSGLPAEIAARQKQYEYYRDKLLTFKEKA